MSEQLLHFFFSDNQLRLDGGETDKPDEPKLIWKAVLRTGTWKMRPGPGGIKLKEPLKIFRDKAPKGHISMTELVKNFDAGAKEYVTTPQVHADGTISDAGFVRKLVIQDVPSEDGSNKTQSLLWAGLEITDSEVKRKVEEKSIVGVSGGILFNYERTEDAKKFGQVLSHVMFTNSPWINGTGGFQDKLPEGVMASEPDDLPVGELELEADEEQEIPLQTDPPGDPTEEPPEGGSGQKGKVVWTVNDGFAWIKGKLQRALEDRRREIMSQFGDNAYRLDYPYYSVDDVQGNGTSGKAMFCSGYGAEKETWVAGYKFSQDGEVEIDAFQSWTPAKPEWVAASEPDSAAPSAAPIPSPPSRIPAAGGVESELRRAQQSRAERFGLSQTTTTGGTRVGAIADLLASKGVELSDEEREAVRREEEETERLRRDAETRAKTDRENKVKTFLASLENTPFDNPGTKKYIQGVMLGDDGGPAVESIELSDNGSKAYDKPLTATGIIEGLFNSLPKDAEGKLTLSSQAPRLPGDQKPPVENPEGGEKPPTREEEIKRSDALLAEMEEAGIHTGISRSNSQGGAS